MQDTVISAQQRVVIRLLYLGRRCMAADNSSRIGLAAACLFWAGIIFAGYKLYHHFREIDLSEQRQLDEARKWTIGRVQDSATGSRSFMSAVARKFTNEDNAETDLCAWFASPMWEHSVHNPNWLSRIKGRTGMQIIAYCPVSSGTQYVDEMRFEWEWEDGTGVIATSWGWAPTLPQAESN